MVINVTMKLRTCTNDLNINDSWVRYIFHNLATQRLLIAYNWLVNDLLSIHKATVTTLLRVPYDKVLLKNFLTGSKLDFCS